MELSGVYTVPAVILACEQSIKSINNPLLTGKVIADQASRISAV
jgi:hypothetical protein